MANGTLSPCIICEQTLEKHLRRKQNETLYVVCINSLVWTRLWQLNHPESEIEMKKKRVYPSESMTNETLTSSLVFNFSALHLSNTELETDLIPFDHAQSQSWYLFLILHQLLLCKIWPLVLFQLDNFNPKSARENSFFRKDKLFLWLMDYPGYL